MKYQGTSRCFRLEKFTFPGFRRLVGRLDQDTPSEAGCFSVMFDEQFKLIFSCLLVDRFMAGNLEDTKVSLPLEFSISEFAASDSGRVREGVTGRVCNTKVLVKKVIRPYQIGKQRR